MADRLTFSASVQVRAAAADAFALVSDLRRKARLNPNIEVIRVELLGEEPVREGSMFAHRFRKGPRIVEYRSRCVRFEPPRLFVSLGEMMRWLSLFPGGRRLGTELGAHQRERVARRLSEELRQWLEAIRQHLEPGGACGQDRGDT